MNKLSLALVTLLVGLQSSPILANAQAVTVKENYIPFYLNGMNYKDNNGVATPELEYDVTAKMLIKNNSVNVNMNTFHYIHFWDSLDTYLGHYATSTAESCNSVCLGVLPSSISTSYAIPLPPTAHTFALERFDRDDANYEISNGVTIEEFFENQTNYYGNNNLQINELSNKTLAELYPGVLLNSKLLTLDYDIAELNNQSLREVFESGQLISNSDFNNGATGWTITSPTVMNITGGKLIHTGGLNSIAYQSKLVANNNYYARIKVDSNATTIRVFSGGSDVNIISIPTSQTGVFTGLANVLSTNGNIAIGGTTAFTVDYVYAYNVTALGIDTLTQAQMDYYYSLYNSLKNNVSLSNQIANNFYTNGTAIIYLPPLKTNKTYSPLFSSTFDLMTDANIKTQLDAWVIELGTIEIYYYLIALTYVPTLTVADFIEYYNFYQWNRTSTFGFTPGVFSYITEDYYADDVREFVWNLTEVFGVGNEPSAVDIGNYENDYFFLDEHSAITETAWRNQMITSSSTIWDDQVASTLDNTFLTIISGAVAFLLMLLGIGYRNPLFNLLSIGAFILFTIQFTNVAMIIVGIALMIINALYVAKRRI